MYIRNSSAYDDKDLFQGLLAKKELIEDKLGYAVEWYELPGRKACRIIITRPGDIKNEDEHEELLAWLCQKAEEFTAVFKKLL